MPPAYWHSIASGFSSGFVSLLLARFLTGAGLGGALANLLYRKPRGWRLGANPVSGWVTHECRLFGAKQRSAMAWFGGCRPFFSTSVAVGSTKREEGSIGASFLHRPGDHRVGE
jgi:hypothetical protein